MSSEIIPVPPLPQVPERYDPQHMRNFQRQVTDFMHGASRPGVGLDGRIIPLEARAKVGAGVVYALHPDFSATTSEAQIQNAIDYAETNGYDFVLVSEGLISSGYDASLVDFTGSGGTWAGRMIRAGQRADVYDVRAYGAAGDGATDDTAAIQAAIDRAKPGSVIYCPPGQYRCEGQIVLRDFLHLSGPTIQLGQGNPADVELTYAGPDAQPFIVTGANPVISNIILRGPGQTGNTATGVSVSDTNITLQGVGFYGWRFGLDLSAVFYFQSYRCEWNRCNRGVRFLTSGSYNAAFFGPRASPVDIFLEVTAPVRTITVFAGSVEGFSASGGFHLNAANTALALWGTYFESSAGNAFGVVASQPNCSVLAERCTVFLNDLNRWIDWGGSAGGKIFSRSNWFSHTQAGSPIAYVPPPSGDVDIRGDDWTEVTAGTPVYISGGGGDGWDVISPLALGGRQGTVQFNSRAGLKISVSAAPPGTPETGAMYLADGTTWDPAAKGLGVPYLVQYDGASFQALW